MSTMTREIISVGAVEVRFLLDGTTGDGLASVFEFDVPAGARVPAPHSHDGFEETVYVLRGRLDWMLGGEHVELRQGEVVCIPRGVVHGFRNDGHEDATALAVVTPGVLGPAYFREVGEVIAAAAGGPPDVAAVIEVMRRHGLTAAPPA